MPRPPRVVHLDEIETIPGPGTLTWHPVRAHLGLRAFGTNAYTAQRVGDDVVEPHDENPDLAHEELYFVARGRATFTLDGETFDAPAGTYVFVPDTATHRHAVAVEAGTTVLSFGGPPTFEPSAWEWMFRGVALAESDPVQARAIVEDGLESTPRVPAYGSRSRASCCARATKKARAPRWATRSRANPRSRNTCVRTPRWGSCSRCSTT
jgi:hypothetical protein